MRRHLRIRPWSGAGLTFLIPAEVRQFRPLLSGYRGSPPRDAPPRASLRS